MFIKVGGICSRFLVPSLSVHWHYPGYLNILLWCEFHPGYSDLTGLEGDLSIWIF